MDARIQHERIDKVRTAIQAHPAIFDMSSLMENELTLSIEEASRALCKTDPITDEHFCRTAACVAGFAWACAMQDREYASLIQPDLDDEIGTVEADHILEIAADYLGLSERDSERMFLMSRSRHHFYDATPEAATRMLDIFKRSGTVEWDRAIAESVGRPEAG